MGGIFTTRANTEARLDGKTVLITGANAGIGKETAKDFYKRGARVLLACRSLDKAKAAVEEIKNELAGIQNLGELVVIHLDLSSLKSVRACAEELLKTEPKINILLNNAGLFGMPYTKTEDGFEMTFGSNYLGHFLFTLLLMPKLIQSAPDVRVVNVSSILHKMTWSLNLEDLNFEKRTYSANSAYNQSKLCNILFTKELDKKLKEKNIGGINVYVVHPGGVKTDVVKYKGTLYQMVWKGVASIFFKSPEQGAQTSIYCCVSEKCANESGLYYSECGVASPSSIAQDQQKAKELWDVSWKMVGFEEDFDPFKV